MGKLLDHVESAQSSGLKEAGISIDALGGKVKDVGAGATAFGHRSALTTVQYTATYDSGPATPATAYVRGFRSAMAPSWGTGPTSTTPTPRSRTTKRPTSGRTPVASRRPGLRTTPTASSPSRRTTEDPLDPHDGCTEG